MSPEQIIDICKMPFNKAREKIKRFGLSQDSVNENLSELEKLICSLIKPQSK